LTVARKDDKAPDSKWQFKRPVRPDPSAPCESSSELADLPNGRVIMAAYFQQVIQGNIWLYPDFAKKGQFLEFVSRAVAYLQHGSSRDLGKVINMLLNETVAMPSGQVKELLQKIRDGKVSDDPQEKRYVWCAIAVLLKKCCQNAGFDMPPLAELTPHLQAFTKDELTPSWKPAGAFNRPIHSEVAKRLSCDTAGQPVPGKYMVRAPADFHRRSNYDEHLLPWQGIAKDIQHPVTKRVVDLRKREELGFREPATFYDPNGNAMFTIHALFGDVYDKDVKEGKEGKEGPLESKAGPRPKSDGVMPSLGSSPSLDPPTVQDEDAALLLFAHPLIPDDADDADAGEEVSGTPLDPSADRMGGGPAFMRGAGAGGNAQVRTPGADDESEGSFDPDEWEEQLAQVFNSSQVREQSHSIGADEEVVQQMGGDDSTPDSVPIPFAPEAGDAADAAAVASGSPQGGGGGPLFLLHEGGSGVPLIVGESPPSPLGHLQLAGPGDSNEFHVVASNSAGAGAQPGSPESGVAAVQDGKAQSGAVGPTLAEALDQRRANQDYRNVKFDSNWSALVDAVERVQNALRDGGPQAAVDKADIEAAGLQIRAHSTHLTQGVRERWAAAVRAKSNLGADQILGLASDTLDEVVRQSKTAPEQWKLVNGAPDLSKMKRAVPELAKFLKECDEVQQQWIIARKGAKGNVAANAVKKGFAGLKLPAAVLQLKAYSDSWKDAQADEEPFTDHTSLLITAVIAELVSGWKGADNGGLTFRSRLGLDNKNRSLQQLKPKAKSPPPGLAVQMLTAPSPPVHQLTLKAKAHPPEQLEQKAPIEVHQAALHAADQAALGGPPGPADDPMWARIDDAEWDEVAKSLPRRDQKTLADLRACIHWNLEFLDEPDPQDAQESAECLVRLRMLTQIACTRAGWAGRTDTTYHAAVAALEAGDLVRAKFLIMRISASFYHQMVELRDAQGQAAARAGASDEDGQVQHAAHETKERPLPSSWSMGEPFWRAYESENWFAVARTLPLESRAKFHVLLSRLDGISAAMRAGADRGPQSAYDTLAHMHALLQKWGQMSSGLEGAIAALEGGDPEGASDQLKNLAERSVNELLSLRDAALPKAGAVVENVGVLNPRVQYLNALCERLEMTGKLLKQAVPDREALENRTRFPQNDHDWYEMALRGLATDDIDLARSAISSGQEQDFEWLMEFFNPQADRPDEAEDMVKSPDSQESSSRSTNASEDRIAHAQRQAIRKESKRKAELGIGDVLQLPEFTENLLSGKYEAQLHDPSAELRKKKLLGGLNGIRAVLNVMVGFDTLPSEDQVARKAALAHGIESLGFKDVRGLSNLADDALSQAAAGDMPASRKSLHAAAKLLYDALESVVKDSAPALLMELSGLESSGVLEFNLVAGIDLFKSGPRSAQEFRQLNGWLNEQVPKLDQPVREAMAKVSKHAADHAMFFNLDAANRALDEVSEQLRKSALARLDAADDKASGAGAAKSLTPKLVGSSDRSVDSKYDTKGNRSESEAADDAAMTKELLAYWAPFASGLDALHKAERAKKGYGSPENIDCIKQVIGFIRTCKPGDVNRRVSNYDAFMAIYREFVNTKKAVNVEDNRLVEPLEAIAKAGAGQFDLVTAKNALHSFATKVNGIYVRQRREVGAIGKARAWLSQRTTRGRDARVQKSRAPGAVQKIRHKSLIREAARVESMLSMKDSSRATAFAELVSKGSQFIEQSFTLSRKNVRLAEQQRFVKQLKRQDRNVMCAGVKLPEDSDEFLVLSMLTKRVRQGWSKAEAKRFVAQVIWHATYCHAAALGETTALTRPPWIESDAEAAGYVIAPAPPDSKQSVTALRAESKSPVVPASDQPPGVERAKRTGFFAGWPRRNPPSTNEQQARAWWDDFQKGGDRKYIQEIADKGGPKPEFPAIDLQGPVNAYLRNPSKEKFRAVLADYFLSGRAVGGVPLELGEDLLEEVQLASQSGPVSKREAESLLMRATWEVAYRTAKKVGSDVVTKPEWMTLIDFASGSPSRPESKGPADEESAEADGLLVDEYPRAPSDHVGSRPAAGQGGLPASSGSLPPLDHVKKRDGKADFAANLRELEHLLDGSARGQKNRLRNEHFKPFLTRCLTFASRNAGTKAEKQAFNIIVGQFMPKKDKKANSVLNSVFGKFVPKRQHEGNKLNLSRGLITRAQRVNADYTTEAAQSVLADVMREVIGMLPQDSVSGGEVSRNNVSASRSWFVPDVSRGAEEQIVIAGGDSLSSTRSLPEVPKGPDKP
jgi:hypothetical protein